MPLPKRSRLERIAQAFADRLLLAEHVALNELAYAYRVAAKALVPEWRKAYRLLQAAKASGLYTDEYLSGFIWREQRLAAMLAQMGEIFEPIGQRTGVVLTQAQRQSIALATQSFTETLALATGQPLGNVVAGLGISFPEAHFERMVGSLTDGSPIANLAQRYGTTGPQVIKDALLAGVANGESPRLVSARIHKALGKHYGNASVLVRTEMLRTYREGTRATYLANQRYVKGWVWCAALDRRTCPVCWAMHGTKHSLGRPMATHPVCRCSMMPDLVPGRLAMLPEVEPGTQSFHRLSRDDQRVILGPMAYRAYQRGMFDLPDLVRETYHNQWGAGRAQRSLVSVIGPQNVARLT